MFASSSFRYLIVRVTSLTKSSRVTPAGYLPRFSSPSFTGVSAVFGDTGAVVLGFVGSVVTVGSTVIKSNTWTVTSASVDFLPSLSVDCTFTV